MNTPLIHLLAEQASSFQTLFPHLKQMNCSYKLTIFESLDHPFPTVGASELLIVDLSTPLAPPYSALRLVFPNHPMIVVMEKKREQNDDPITIWTTPFHLQEKGLELLALLLEARGVSLRLRDTLRKIVGETEQMVSIKGEIALAARSLEPVLISGEEGTGKELVAQVIGSLRDPWVVFDCQTHQQEKMELKLFGCIRGHLPGATSDRIGALESAHGGSLLIDEVELLPLDLQAKLFRVLSSAEFRPIGAALSKKLTCRLIATTRINLKEAVLNGTFRRDLFSLLSTIPFQLPPLRERRSDIPLLVQQMVQKHSRSTEHPPSWSNEALSVLVTHPFWGNVAELDLIVKRSVALQHYGTISSAVVLQAIEDLSLHSSPEPWSHFNHAQFHHWLRDQERAWLTEHLRRHHGSVSRTAERLGIGRTALHQRIKALKIELTSLRSLKKESLHKTQKKDFPHASR